MREQEKVFCTYSGPYRSDCKYTICPLTLACIITSHDLLSENPSFAGPSVNLSLFCKETFERRSATQKQLLFKGPIKGVIYAYFCQFIQDHGQWQDHRHTYIDFIMRFGNSNGVALVPLSCLSNFIVTPLYLDHY